MPDYTAEYTQYTKKSDVLIRLTYDDTRFLAGRIKDALERKTGVNLVFLKMNGAFSQTASAECGREIKCIAYNRSGIRVESEMRGYNGRWSHVEIALPFEALEDLEDFLLGVYLKTSTEVKPESTKEGGNDGNQRTERSAAAAQDR